MKIHLTSTLTIFILFISISLLLPACESGLEKTNSIASKDSLPDMAVYNVKSDFTEDTWPKSKMEAPLLNNYTSRTNPFYEFPKGVKLTFFDKNKNEESFLTADYAVFYTKKDTWEARGNVVLKNRMGKILKTEELFGDEKTEKIYSVKEVSIINSDGSPGIKSSGGFEADKSFTNYEFKNVKGFVETKFEKK